MSNAERASAVAASKPPGASSRRGSALPALKPVEVLQHPEHPHITLQIELITPSVAERYLQLIPDWQRNESETTTDQYVDDMIDDDWWFTGDPIKFTKNNELLDGRHRCTAIVTSGKPQYVPVVRGLDAQVMRVLDTGYQRRFSNYLSTQKIPLIQVVSTITGKILDWQRGNYADPSIARIPQSRHLNAKKSHQKLIHVFESMRDEIISAAREGKRIRTHFPGSAPDTTFGFAYLMLNRLDPYRAAEFFRQLTEAPGNDPTYPIRALEKQLTIRANEKGIPAYTWLSWIFLAWNEWLNDQSLSRERLRNIRRPRWNLLPMPDDPNHEAREEGWEPL
jgi:hypothetical protein